MAGTKVEVLEEICTEIDESKIKIIFSSQCIKAQVFLVKKLKKETNHLKEVCSFISSANVKLEAEIKLAEQEIKNLIIAHDTIKLGNIELRKEWLLKTSEKLEIVERITSGENKYQQLWLESKNRFESIPYVQKYLQIKNRSQVIQNNINKLFNEYLNLRRLIKINKNALLDQDQNMIINLVTFLVKERPKIIHTLHDKVREIKELNAEIANLEDKDPKSKTQSKLGKGIDMQQSQQIEGKSHITNLKDNTWPCLSKNENEALLMPKLQLQVMDLDLLSVKLGQIKEVNLDAEQQKEAKMIDRAKNYCTTGSKISIQNSSTNFNNIDETFDQNSKTKNYSERKLIHILKDVQLDNIEILEIISKVNPSQLCNVNAIRSEISEVQEFEEKVSQASSVQDVHNNKKKTEQPLEPPTQFLYERKGSQEKKVSFDVSMEIGNCKVVQQDSFTDDGTNNEILISQNDNLIFEEGNEKLKPEESSANLDSSQFKYNEHSILHKMTQDKTITSKFFDPERNLDESNDFKKNNCDDNIERTGIDSNKLTQNTNIVNDCVNPDVKMDEIVLSKICQNDEKVDLPITGLLFNYGSQGVPDSLNLSESTMGFEEGDGDFPHCIDSNILLSPKADITVESADEDVKVQTQELPNFMTGGRKRGLSLFEWSSGDSNPKSKVQNADSNFSFNFPTTFFSTLTKSGEKKDRGGFFNMFH